MELFFKSSLSVEEHSLPDLFILLVFFSRGLFSAFYRKCEPSTSSQLSAKLSIIGTQTNPNGFLEYRDH